MKYGEKRKLEEQRKTEMLEIVDEVTSDSKGNSDKPKKKFNYKKAIKIIKKNRRVQIALGILVIILILLIVLITKGIKTISYHMTDEYKLTNMGYTLDEVNKMLLNLDEEGLDYIYSHEYNSDLDDFLLEKYCIVDKMNSYIETKKAYPNKTYKDIVSLVNTNRNRECYTDTVAADTSLGEKMLVNKYYFLSENYEPENVVSVSLSCAFEGVKLSEVACIAFEEMCEDAKAQGHTIVANAGYRTFDWQNTIWNDYKGAYGIDYADEVAARAGSSEHQTGLAVNVLDYDSDLDFEKTSSYSWVKAHAYEYGFIIRYPEGTSEITGFEDEPSHLRYVGVELATAINNEGITFDEYYAYYIESNN